VDIEQQIETVKNADNEIVNHYIHFPVNIYSINAPRFLPEVTQISDKYLEIKKNEIKDLNEIYPVVMTDNFFTEPSINEFVSFVGNTAFNVLESQGFDLKNLATTFYEMWTQEHYKMSGMEQHIHGYGSHLVGFYFLECPENCSKVIFHDPKPGKVQMGLQEQDSSIATAASNMINFEPKVGQLMITNSWLPHSFTRHGSDKSMKFVHFTIGLAQNPNAKPVENTNVEIV